MVEVTQETSAWETVARLEQDRRDAACEVAVKSEQLKATKEVLAGITEKLHRAIWDASHPEESPLFNPGVAAEVDGYVFPLPEYSSIRPTRTKPAKKPRKRRRAGLVEAGRRHLEGE